jgi:hypothetical protein
MRTGEDNDGVIKNWRIIVVAGSETGSLTRVGKENGKPVGPSHVVSM